ncbi:LysR family transcriptional regulator [Pseudomonas sp.]|jgi:DNA-binding transcriptional LysR family regulator|uniref:LysR family transcriptional regulator n=1 Tax=Pseudomonas sp. TaxID=306 RepID=UPI002E339777|nr:LysR family transcriptional regulator [Pseudomonas sp.]HEX4551062.1 LysR family transcriptional regulator [Pseudomonas sp.]
MSTPDLNLLITLDVLLSEGSVAGAAARLGLSASAMSRALARLRETTGDPLLVRAGRGLVPTPRALELRERVSALVQEVEAVLRPVQMLDVRQLHRTFTLRSSDGFVETFAAALLARIAEEAPGVRLRFLHKTDKDSALLREGRVDLETGVVGDTTDGSLHSRILFRDRFVGVVNADHALTSGKISAKRFAAGEHILVSRRGRETAVVDEVLLSSGLTRNIVITVGGFAAALTLVRETHLIACVPERHTRNLRTGLYSFTLPFTLPQMNVSMLWHPRMDADPAHRWLRNCVREVCA